MTDHDVHTLTGAHALNALDTEERAVFERHLADCPACRQEVSELQATAARLASLASSPAPEMLRQRVFAEVGHTRQVPPRGASTIAPTPGPAVWYRQPATAAAALLLVVAVGLGGLAIAEDRDGDRARVLASRIAEVAADPGRTERTVAMPSGGTGTIVTAGDLAVFRSNGLPELPEGKAYQLWRVTDQLSQSAGILGRGGEMTGVVTGLGPDDRVGVTVEPAAGSDQPTTEPVFLVAVA